MGKLRRMLIEDKHRRCMGADARRNGCQHKWRVGSCWDGNVGRSGLSQALSGHVAQRFWFT